MTKANNMKDLMLDDLDLDFDFDLEDENSDLNLDNDFELEEKNDVNEIDDLDDLLDNDEEDDLVLPDFNDDELEIEDDEEEIIEEVKEKKPVAKSTSKVKATKKEETVKNVKQPSTKTHKVTSSSVPARKGRTRVRNVVNNKSYETLFETVVAKVTKYDEIMQLRAEGKTKEIPQSPVISRDLLIALLTARANELTKGGLKLSTIKAMVSMGYDKEEAIKVVQAYNFKRTELDSIYTMINDVIYEIVSEGSGIPLFKTEDCNATISGKWNAERLSDNKHLNTNKASFIESYLSVQVKSPAPANKKHLGTIKNGKFVPESK